MRTFGVGRSFAIDVGRFGAIDGGLGAVGETCWFYRTACLDSEEKVNTERKAILGGHNLLEMFNTTQGRENNQLGKSILEC